METGEIQQPLLDVNGREIKVGSFGRLSEEGRNYVFTFLPNWITTESVNLRFKVIDIDSKTNRPIVELTEVTTSSKFMFPSRYIVIEN